MKNYKKNVRILVIDRGYLETQYLCEEQFISFLGIELESFERKINKVHKGSKFTINYEIISIMRDITNDEAFVFIDDEKKLKELKYDYYHKLDQEFPDYVARYSSDKIKHSIGRTIYDNLNVFIVYAESKEELEMLDKHYPIKAILKFCGNQDANNYEDNFKRIYINSIPQALKIIKEMPLFLFQDIKELQSYFIN